MGLFDAIVQATLSHEGGSKLNTRGGEGGQLRRMKI